MDKYKQKLIHALSDINTDGEVVRWIERNFPELRESEDERIRQALCDIVRDMPYMETELRAHGLNVERVLAYLEKQKEPHFTKRNALFDKCVENCAPEVMKEVSDEIDEMLEKEQKTKSDIIGYAIFSDGSTMPIKDRTKEQKPAECITDSALQKIKRAITDCKNLSEHFKDTKENFYQYYGGKAEGLQLALTYFRNENEQPPEEYVPDSVKFEEGFKTGRELGFREGVESVKPAEWSEEDKTMINHIIEALQKWANGQITILQSQAEEYAKRLKSLRPSWKPSEEQMIALYNMIPFVKSECAPLEAVKPLESLYEDLKKL